jgi:hypothetical protein
MATPSLSRFNELNPDFADETVVAYVESLITKHYSLLKKNRSSKNLIELAVYEFVKADICIGPYSSIFALSEKNRAMYIDLAKDMLRRGNQHFLGC